MPLYRFITPIAATTPDRRAAIAAAVTQMHCDLTGAPPTFVHVFFTESADTNSATPHLLHAVHRAGRSDETKAELLSKARHAYATILDIDPEDVTARLDETPAKWIMEGGVVLPEPGEEQQWLEMHPEHVPAT